MTIASIGRRRFALKPPTLRLLSRRKTAVLKLAANGIEYQAILNLDDRNRADPTELAGMLDRLAACIRRNLRQETQ